MGRVLCSENDPDSRELIVLVLKATGYEVVCTETGITALDLAKNERFDLFLVDSWMPGITGPDLTRIIREFIRPRQSSSTLPPLLNPIGN
jgi:CheY-like chemotaxis protein